MNEINIIDSAVDEADLDKQWDKWNQMTYLNRKRSNDICLSKYGVINLVRYEQLKGEFNKITPLPDVTYDDIEDTSDGNVGDYVEEVMSLKPNKVYNSKITEDEAIRQGGFYDSHLTWNSILKLENDPNRLYRGRVECLIIDNDTIYLCKKRDTYRIPGGSFDIDNTNTIQCYNECKEEALILVKNIKNTGIVYTRKYASPADWALHLPIRWTGQYTEVYVADFDQYHNGMVEEKDRDYDMYRNGSFYKIDEVYDTLRDVHKQAIDIHVRNNPPSRIKIDKDDSTMVSQDILVCNDMYIRAKEWVDSYGITMVISRYSLDDLERSFNDFMQMTYHQKKISNQESIRIFGFNNITHYNYLKSNLLKKDAPDVNIVDIVAADPNSTMTESMVEGIYVVSEAKVITGRERDVKDDIMHSFIAMGISERDINRTVFNLARDGEVESMSSKGALDSSIKHKLELYDEKREKAILESKDIVQEYKHFIDCEFEKLINTSSKSDIDVMFYKNIWGMYLSIKRIFRETNLIIPDSTLRKYLKDSFFEISDDPKVIRETLKLRLSYNKRMIKILENMLKVNYSVLGISSSEADYMVSQLNDSSTRSLSIAQIKDIIVKNKSKFEKRKGFIDLRPIGGGVMFGSSEETGLSEYTSLENLFQTMLRYDCIIFGHGNSSRPDGRTYSEPKVWTIQPVRTETAGPFTEMDDLLRQVIKELKKDGKQLKIMVISCNPGHHEIAKDILDMKGIIINRPKNTLLAESGSVLETTDPVFDILNETEAYLIEFAKECGIDYHDNEVLFEAYCSLEYGEDDIVTEGALKTLWGGVVKLVEKIIQTLLYLFKNFIALIRSMYGKIKELFTGKKDMSLTFKQQKVSFIQLEGAKVKEIIVSDFNSLQKSIIASCDTISKEVDRVSKKQTEITRQIARYSEKKYKESLNESFSLYNVPLDIKKEMDIVYEELSYDYNKTKVYSMLDSLSSLPITLSDRVVVNKFVESTINFINKDNDKVFLPYFSPNEMEELGVFNESKEDNYYNSISSDKSINEWFEIYKATGNPGSDWYTEASRVYSEMMVNPTLENKQKVLEYGWNPEIQLDLDTAIQVTENTRLKLHDRYSVDVIDITESLRDLDDYREEAYIATYLRKYNISKYLLKDDIVIDDTTGRLFTDYDGLYVAHISIVGDTIVGINSDYSGDSLLIELINWAISCIGGEIKCKCKSDDIQLKRTLQNVFNFNIVEDDSDDINLYIRNVNTPALTEGHLKGQYTPVISIDRSQDKNIFANIFEKLHPVYIVTTYTASPFGKAVRKITKDTYTHASLGFTSALDRLYSYNISNGSRSGGLSQESIKGYINDNKDADIGVSVIYLKERDHMLLKERLDMFLSNSDRTSYNFKNLFNILINKAETKANQFSMVCSQFVDNILKTINVDITNKPSNLVTPGDLSRVNNPKVYKVYEGKAKDYSYRKIDRKLSKLSYTIEPIKEAVFIDRLVNDIVYAQPIFEAKEFPVGFEDDGSLIIRNYKSLDYEMEYNKANKLLRSYKANSNMYPMAYELCKLWFINTVLLKKIEVANKKNKVDEKEKLVKLRAKVMNAFTIYLNELNRLEKDFNFSAYYDDTPFSDTAIRISGSTLKYTKDYLLKLFV